MITPSELSVVIPVALSVKTFLSIRVRCAKSRFSARRLSPMRFPINRLCGELLTVTSRIRAKSLSSMRLAELYQRRTPSPRLAGSGCRERMRLPIMRLLFYPCRVMPNRTLSMTLFSIMLCEPFSISRPESMPS